MGSFIFWIIILFFIISSVRKGKKKTGTSNETEAQRQRYEQPQKTNQQTVKKQKPGYDYTARQTKNKQKAEQGYMDQQRKKEEKTGQSDTDWQTGKRQKNFDTSYKKKEKVGAESPKKSHPYAGTGTNAQQHTSAEDDQQSIFDQNEIVAAAKANTREVERDNDRDAENQNLMEEVYEVMVKGPETNIEFQRDFIAEGMDMLNAFQDL